MAHLRPGLERQLAFYASWALQVDPDALADLAVAVGATRQAAGETVLGRIRRWVAETDGDVPEEALPALLAARGLAHAALLPLEGPVPPPRRNGKAAPAPAAADAAAAAPAAADPAQAGAVGAPAAGPGEA